MPVERFFTDGALEKGLQITLENNEFHHLVHVFRIATGESVELVNGQGALANAKVETIGKRSAVLQVNAISFQEPPKLEVIIAQAIPRLNRLDFIVEKGTELGMDQLWLFPGKQGERKQLTDHQLEHYKAIAVAAMKQCGRLYLPKIIFKPTLDKWESLNGNGNVAFFGDLSPSAPTIHESWKQHRPNKQVLFFIGPESGFSKEEIAFFHQNRIHGVKLHSNILRTDTASLTALSQLWQERECSHGLPYIEN